MKKLHDDSWISEQLRRSKNDLQSFVSAAEFDDDLGTPQTAIGWFRMLLAAASLGVVFWLTGNRFVDYVVHHVWYQSRNSPMALIVPVLAVEFLWVISHVPTGGLIARLKIGFGAAAVCMTLFAPSFPSVNSGGVRSMDWPQLLALALATWVFVDGWRDRRANLLDDQDQDLAGQRP